ncbi:unnamed protein product [Rotaria sordida]|uniref:non-specific serine/threonine protein kinase n=1 Tax=Rotaria sordida TaxID=392033 RepID=A0A814F3R8_9BILA|nr:unnamed protein product [Rotaria sordida]CAF0976131.1 unnamed protein product [Rotaria sordida]
MNMSEHSDEFKQCSKTFIEIRIPSPILELGIHVCDTPGFLGSDVPILRENLLALVASVHPTLVFLHDNPTGSDDSRKCYEELKLALHSHSMGADIFFLNTKADVAVIRRDANNNDDDEILLNRERLRCYDFLMKIDEMKGDVHHRIEHNEAPSFNKCYSFDIFSNVAPNDPMEQAMKRHAIDRIIHFAAEHDLRLTKYVINIVHTAIDAFFDFILVTNRRSLVEWNRLRDDAIEWGESFFRQYRSIVDKIANEANRRLPQRFREKRPDIETRAIKDCETRGIQWDERLEIPASHHGSRPDINEEEVLGSGGFFTVHPASWDNEHELVAKKLQNHIIGQNFAYLEAHFHRTLTNLNIAHMIPLKYLYEDDNSSLYLLLPRYRSNLHKFLVENMERVTADKAIKISRNIANVIAHLHAYDLVHRGIKVENILMDEDEVYLADFGTCQVGIENTTLVGFLPLPPELIQTLDSSSNDSARQYSYQGTAVDVHLLGRLMYACAPKDVYTPPSNNINEQLHLLDRKKVPEKYCQLIARCVNKDPNQRPTAKEIVDELDSIEKSSCVICEEAPRFARFEPCGHKALCVQCLNQIQQTPQPKCVICRQIFINVQEDNNANTFFASSLNSTR